MGFKIAAIGSVSVSNLRIQENQQTKSKSTVDIKNEITGGYPGSAEKSDVKKWQQPARRSRGCSMAASFPPFMVFQEKHNSSLHRGASQPQMSRGHHPVLIRSSLWLRIRSSSSKERGREEEGERVLGSWDFSCEELKKTRRLVF